MAEIRPFRGWRYDTERAGDLASLIAPPYDVISPAEQQQFYASSPYNVIRLELTAPEPTDPSGEEGQAVRHARARATLDAWTTEGVLARDADPSMYLYEQHFHFRGQPFARRSVIVAVRLAPWSAGKVLRHEHTMARPKAERLALLRATSANISPIWSLYTDPKGIVASVLDEFAEADSLGEATDAEGTRHRLWAINSRQALERLSQGLAAHPLYIADGHHRYETALAFQTEGHERPGHADAGPRDFVLMVLSAADDPALIVLPTHRMVRNIAPERLAGLADWLAEHFVISDLPLPTDPLSMQVELDSVLTPWVSTATEHTFAMLGPEPDRLRLLQLRDTLIAGPAPSDTLVDLDVWLAHAAILDGGLGISARSLEQQAHIEYTRNASEALESVRAGRHQLALFLAPTPVGQLLDVARAGGVMPQKSTYFYPKPATGLVIRRLEPS